jgi:hypothetical protein
MPVLLVRRSVSAFRGLCSAGRAEGAIEDQAAAFAPWPPRRA